MAFSITLEKEHLKWLEDLIGGQIERVNRSSNPESTGGWSAHIEHMLAIKEACENKKTTESTVERKPVQRRTKDEVEAEKNQALCKDHPLRTLKKRPTDDCKTCWAEYKRLEPMKFDKAWRDYKQSVRKKES